MFEILPLIFGVFLAQASPGPNLAAVATRSLGCGRRHGMAAAAGIASGVFIWAIAFTFGIAALFQSFPETIVYMKILGGSYLLFLTLTALRSAITSKANLQPDKITETKLASSYFGGLLVVLTNPKAALMWVAISAFLSSGNLTDGQFLIIGMCVSLSAMTIYGVYALMFSTGMAMRAHQRFARIVESMFAVIFGVFGAKLMISGFRELQP